MIKKLILISVLVVILLSLGYAGARYGLGKYREYKEEQIRKQLSFQILEGATADPGYIDVNFGKQVSKGSPLIFGGAHTPLPEHIEAWDKIKEAGITNVRIDFDMGYMIRNTNLNDYKNNKNDIQNIDNWNKNYMNKNLDKFKRAREKGIKTMGIVDYTPLWLSHDKKHSGMPLDFVVFKDVVKKSYLFYRPYLDYVEIWNEPSLEHFLNVRGTGYSSEQVYKLIFKSATEAIRETDAEINDGKKVQIGAPAAHSPFNTTFLEILMLDNDLKKQIDFVSYHNYDANNNINPSDKLFRKIMEKYNMGSLPVYITEWNYNSDGKASREYNYTEKGMLYTANKILELFKMKIAGANYYSLDPIRLEEKNDTSTFSLSSFGFYRWENGRAELLPQAKTWRLLSRSMGLGAGESRIMETAHPDTINSIGFVNIKGEEGVAIVNDREEKQLAELRLTNNNVENRARVEVYFASELYDGGKPVHSQVVEMLGGVLRYRMYVPPQTVVGIKIVPEKRWYDFLDKLIE